MPRRKKQTKTAIANQISRLASGRCEARVKHKGKVYAAQFDGDTPLHEMQQWQIDKKKELDTPMLDSTPAVVAPDANLESRLDAFLPQIAGRVSFKADRSHLRAWLCAKGADGVELGQKAPRAITTADINVVIGAWRSPLKVGHARAIRRVTVTAYGRDGKAIQPHTRKTPATSKAGLVAIKTVRHRCRLLREFLRAEGVSSVAIDGDPTRNIEGAKIPKVEATVPVGVPIRIIRDVAKELAKVPEWADTYGRYLVLNTTGQRPAQLMRTQPDDVKLKKKLWIVQPAKGSPGHTVTLNAEMVQAWQVFIAANAWGTYDPSLHAKRLRLCGWPETIRPYNARHSVAQDALQNYDVKLDDVQGLLGHTTPQETRRAYGPLAIKRQQHISDRLVGRFKGIIKTA